MAGAEKKVETTYGRLLEMLRHAAGPEIIGYLEDPNVVEIMLNPDSKLWVDTLSGGRLNTGVVIRPIDAEKVIRLVANSSGAICDEEHPILSAELPGDGSRFQGMLPKIVLAPTFTIRKKALHIFTLDNYVEQGIMTVRQKEVIVEAALGKKNILVVGGTGSGKTTLVNGILQEISKTGDRIILIEDTVELQCSAADLVAMRTRDGAATMNDLLKSTMRLRPDRIVVGEVRGREALTLLKSWNTGHPGGCATVHANSAKSGLTRLESLVSEDSVTPQKALIAEAVNVIVFIERYGHGRRIREIVKVNGLKDGEYDLEDVV